MFCTLNAWMVWYMDYISIKLLLGKSGSQVTTSRADTGSSVPLFWVTSEPCLVQGSQEPHTTPAPSVAMTASRPLLMTRWSPHQGPWRLAALAHPEGSITLIRWFSTSGSGSVPGEASAGSPGTGAGQATSCGMWVRMLQRSTNSDRKET